jgi:lipopolysaccharide transport system permease protein
MINPVTMPVEIFRYALIGKGTINLLFLTVSLVITILVAVFGIMIFNKVERTFMDTV